MLKKYNICREIKVVGIFCLLFAACTKTNDEPSYGLWKLNGDKVDVTVNCDFTQKSHVISNRLIGFNVIYSHCDDDFWSSSGIKEGLKELNCGYLRWPGGAPTNRFHWDNLNGQGWKDNWDPDYDSKDDKPQSAFTDIDEYIQICKETGASPLLGINMGSGLRFDRVDDALAEAKTLVQYCLDNNYGVDYFYLDNEPYHRGANYTMTLTEYAEQIKLYSPAIKTLNPNAKIVINWDKVRKNSTWKIIEQAGEHIDVLEVHWYWNWGQATFSSWLKQMPMNSSTQWYEGGSYKEEIEWFNEKVKALGFDHISLASFEWNVGPSSDNSLYPTKYQNALMQGEMLMQFMDGGMEMAAFWPIFWPKLNEDYNPNRYLMDPSSDYELLPSYDMFMLLSGAMGLTKFETSSNVSHIYTLGVCNNEQSEALIFLHHKGAKESITEVMATEFAHYSLKILVPNDETLHWGEITKHELIYDAHKGVYRFTLPAYSIARIALTE